MSLGIKKGDIVVVLSGDDKGKSGKIKEIRLKDQTVLVEGVNMVKKHQRMQRQGGESGIIDVEAPVHVSNIALYDGKSGKPTRYRIGLSKDGKKVRVGVETGTVFD